jgi:hypothetical protein
MRLRDEAGRDLQARVVFSEQAPLNKSNQLIAEAKKVTVFVFAVSVTVAWFLFSRRYRK